MDVDPGLRVVGHQNPVVGSDQDGIREPAELAGPLAGSADEPEEGAVGTVHLHLLCLLVQYVDRAIPADGQRCHATERHRVGTLDPADPKRFRRGPDQGDDGGVDGVFHHGDACAVGQRDASHLRLRAGQDCREEDDDDAWEPWHVAFSFSRNPWSPTLPSAAGSAVCRLTWGARTCRSETKKTYISRDATPLTPGT